MPRFRLSCMALVWAMGVGESPSGDQAALEYGGTTFRNMLYWAKHTTQDNWYYIVGGVVVLVLLWGYARK